MQSWNGQHRYAALEDPLRNAKSHGNNIDGNRGPGCACERVGFNDHVHSCGPSSPSWLHLGTGTELRPPDLSYSGCRDAGARDSSRSPRGPLRPSRQPLVSRTTASSLLAKSPFKPCVPQEGIEEKVLLSQPRPAGAGNLCPDNLCPGESLKSIFSARHPSPHIGGWPARGKLAGGGRAPPPSGVRVCICVYVFAARADCTPSSSSAPRPLGPGAAAAPEPLAPPGRCGPTWARKRSC